MKPEYLDMLPLRGWTIWYDNGSTFSSEDGSWKDAPDQGVQVVCFRHDPPYRTFFSGDDTYHHPDHDDVKHGRWIETDEFYALLRIAEMEG